METRHFDAIVIGAGMAGATAAAHLAATHRVALLEAEESAGKTVASPASKMRLLGPRNWKPCGMVTWKLTGVVMET